MMDGAPAGFVEATKTSEPRALTKTEYMTIRSALDLKPSIFPNLLVASVDGMLLYASGALLRHGATWSFCLAELLLAVVFFNAFGLLHDCGHSSASASPAWNVVLGHLASTFCFIPFFPWRYIHQKHHVWAGNLDRDPVLRSLRRWRDHGVPRSVRTAWNWWIPMGALLQHVVYLSYPYQMWRAGEMTRPKLARTMASVLWMPMSYAALHFVAPDVVRFSNLWPALVLFLVAEELVNIPHHVGMPTFTTKLPVWEQYQTTRSCYYPLGISEALVLNFNFHIEHHLFPDLPWYRLRNARSLVRATLAERYNEEIGINWNLANRKRGLQTIVDTTAVKK